MNRRHPILPLFVVLAVFVAACGDDDSATTTTPEPTTTVMATTTEVHFEAPPEGVGTEWAPEFIVSFMEGCTIDATEEQCQCMLTEFQDRYAFDDFMAWAFEAAEDDPRILEVVAVCSP